MPRSPRPWFRRQTGSWYVCIDGKQVPLSKDRDEAHRIWHRFMARRQRVPAADAPDATVASILDTFLVWCRDNRRRRTFDVYRQYLQSFLDHAGKELLADELKPFHVMRWVEQHPDWSASTKNLAIRSVQRPFNWAVRQGFLDRSPVANVEKPTPGRREAVLSNNEWQAALELFAGDPFQDLLVALRETGCRVHEARTVEARHFVETRHGDQEIALWVFPAAESKKNRQRTVVLTDRVRDMCRRLTAKYPKGPMFRNRQGRAWSKNAIVCRFRRLRERLSLPEGTTATTIRHTYCTRALESGVDPVTLATLMGHADTSMVARVYAHLQLDHLKRAAQQAAG